MSESAAAEKKTEPAATAAGSPYRERVGLNRKMVMIGGLLIGGILLYAFGSTFGTDRSDPDREQQVETIASSADSEDSGGARPAAPAWAGTGILTQQERAADEAAAAQTTAVEGLGEAPGASGFVPLGNEVQPGSYGSVGSGDPTDGGAYVPPGSGMAGGAGSGTVSPEEMATMRRREMYEAAVVSRELVGTRRMERAAERARSARPAAGEETDRGDALWYTEEDQRRDRSEAAREAVEFEQQMEAARGRERQDVGPVSMGHWGSASVFSYASFDACSERVIRAGTVIPAVLITGINSDLPGVVRAQVGSDVYDGQVRCVVVPAGTMLLGRQHEGAKVGQNRMIVAWMALQLPNGETVMLEDVHSADRAGAAGIPGKVDRRTREIFGEAAMISSIAAGVALAQPPGRSDRNGGYYESSRGRAAGAAAEQMNETSRQYLERNVQIQPTLRVPGGTRFNVLLAEDVDLDRKAKEEAAEAAKAAQSAARDRVVGS